MKMRSSSGSRRASATPLSADELRRMDALWRAANYLSVGQIYLLDNPLLRAPLTRAHVKPRLLGHWGTTPGLNFVYTHLNRVITKNDLDMMYVIGPGHGGPALVAHAYLEGTYSEIYTNIGRDEEGLKRLFKQFSFPGGVPSHVAPETPGSIHEGGELGYALAHAYGAAFDNPELIVACIVGDGEAETGPLAAGWHGNKFLNPVRDGCVLPILHLNGYKIASPCFLARIPEDELRQFLAGCGYAPLFVTGDEPEAMHQAMAAALDAVVRDIRAIQEKARTLGFQGRPAWPMIVLRTPKGWTGPAEVDGKKTEGHWRSHQVPMGDMDKPEHLALLEQWLRSYRPEELFDERGALVAELAALAPRGERRMSANPHANGGLLRRDLRLPDFRAYAVEVRMPGGVDAESTRVQGKYLRDVMKLNLDQRNFRLFSPDENNSNRWNDVLDVTDRCWVAEIHESDDHLSPDGRLMEVLSEHQCQGWLEGYLLTGRHGFFSCYEAFIHIVDSMFNQHAKWLKVCNEIPWRRPISSLNYLLSSHVWRQDHNGFSHQDPGFIDHVVNKKAEVIRVYLPPDANTLLVTTHECLGSVNTVNVIVAGKQPAPQWLTMDEAIKHCAAGLGIWKWASNDEGHEPDVVMACCGDVPTLETLAAVELLRAAPTGAESARSQRRRSHEASAARGASSRPVEPGIRRHFHEGQADHFRVPRLPFADSSTDLSAHQSPQFARARLQRRRHDHHAVRHGRAERPRSLPPRGGRHRPRAEARRARSLSETNDRREAGRAQDLHPRARPRHAGDRELALGDGVCAPRDGASSTEADNV